MAYMANDTVAAQQAFATIGEQWDETVWTNRQAFEYAKAWSTGQIPGADPGSAQ